MTKLKNEDVKEYFIKLCLDGDSKEEIATELWRRMTKKEKAGYKKELEEYSKDGELKLE